jgi:hypothetical protein
MNPLIIINPLDIISTGTAFDHASGPSWSSFAVAACP